MSLRTPLETKIRDTPDSHLFHHGKRRCHSEGNSRRRKDPEADSSQIWFLDQDGTNLVEQLLGPSDHVLGADRLLGAAQQT